MFKRFVQFILVSLLCNPLAVAQSPSLGSWNILNFKYNLNQKCSLFSEGQLRSLKFYSNFHYYEFKGGFDYKVYKNVRLSLGAGSYQTYREGGNFLLPKNNNELRIWPQLVLDQYIGSVKIEQRYRAELRFTSNGYRNRFRYRLGIVVPLGKERDDFQPWQLNVNNELFFTDKEPFFERNRIQGNVNFKPNKTMTIQLGYLHQFDYKINDETGRDFLVVGFYYELSRSNTSKK